MNKQTKAKSHKNQIRSREIDVRPFYWDKLTKVVSLDKSLYAILQLIDLKVVLIMPFRYKLMQVMKENIICMYAKD